MLIVEEIRSSLSIALIVVSIGLWLTNNVTDAIYTGVIGLWVRPEK